MPIIQIADTTRQRKDAFVQLKKTRRMRRRMTRLRHALYGIFAINLVEFIWDLYRHQWHYFFIPLYGAFFVAACIWVSREHSRAILFRINMIRTNIHVLKKMETVGIKLTIPGVSDENIQTVIEGGPTPKDKVN